MSLTDEISNELRNKTARDAGKAAKEGLKAAGSLLRVGKQAGGKTIKGICLILSKGTDFTTDNVMKAVRDLVFAKTGNLEFSSQNIDMEKLQKEGSVSKIEDKVAEDVMHHFNKYCRKYGVRYSAMKDEREPENPGYMVFYNGKSADLILSALQEAYKDYMHEKKQERNQEHNQEGSKEDRKQEKEINKGGEKKSPDNERESIMAKLEFFRNRIADGEERDGIGEHLKEKQEELSR